MSGDLRGWIFAAVLLLFVLGMILWARGTEHHHGQYVGAIHSPYAVSAPTG